MSKQYNKKWRDNYLKRPRGWLHQNDERFKWQVREESGLCRYCRKPCKTALVQVGVLTNVDYRHLGQACADVEWYWMWKLGGGRHEPNRNERRHLRMPTPRPWPRKDWSNEP